MFLMGFTSKNDEQWRSLYIVLYSQKRFNSSDLLLYNLWIFLELLRSLWYYLTIVQLEFFLIESLILGQIIGRGKRNSSHINKSVLAYLP